MHWRSERPQIEGRKKAFEGKGAAAKKASKWSILYMDFARFPLQACKPGGTAIILNAF
jgi:hypothetical protein